MKFISTLNQKPETLALLPVGEIKGVHAGISGTQGAGDALQKGSTEFLFEASANDVLGALLPHSLNFQIYQILLEAKASEHSSRMVAMKNATDHAEQQTRLTLETQQPLGDRWVRTVAMSSTEGLKRGLEVIDTGAPISFPVGEAVMGRVLAVTGTPLDERGPVKAEKYYPIPRPAPPLLD